MSSPSFEFRYAVRSHRGPVRKNNQDAAYSDRRVLALADGMGGRPAGDVASSLVIEPFARLDHGAPSGGVVDRLRRATFRGEHAIAAHVAAHPHRDGMGTTLTAVLLDGERLGMLHVGDSRAYLLRAGLLCQLSHDDTLVQSLVDRRMLAPHEARVHPHRSVLLRALTGRGTRFSLADFDVKEHDRLLLCSDGISDVLSDDALTEASTDPDLEVCAESLIALALLRGTRDNVTCIVAEVVATGSESPPVSAGAFVAVG